ncbi:GAF and ANTAR domain-containing protein [Intrasporangium mesophilum]
MTSVLRTTDPSPTISPPAPPHRFGGPDSIRAVETALATSAEAIPGVEHVAIALVDDDGRPRTMAASDDLARHLGEIQLTLNEGPLIDVLSRSTYEMVAMREAPPDRWVEFIPRARALGMTVAVAIRLTWEGRVIGALCIYASRSAHIRPETVAMAETFASHASATVMLANKAEHLELAMHTRQRIGQAVGILMERYHLDSDSAFSYLRRISQNENVKVRDLADELVTGGRLPEEPEPAA